MQIFLYFRYFQGIPADNPSARHIYSVKDDISSSSRDSINAPSCLTCQLPDEIKRSCTFSEALFSNRYFNFCNKISYMSVSVAFYNSQKSLFQSILDTQNTNRYIYQYSFSDSFEHLVLKCLGPDVPSSYLLQIIKSDPETYPTDKDDQGYNNTINNTTKNPLRLVHVLDLNNQSFHLLNGLAWPKIEITENVTLSNGRVVRTKLYYPPELRANEIFKFPMVVHV